MIDYNAPKPTYSPKQWGQFIIPRIFFPPILLWDLLKTGVNYLFGNIIAKKLVLPALSYFSSYSLTENSINELIKDKTYLKASKFNVNTYDGGSLSTFEIQHPSQTKHDIKDQQYIINFIGNSTCYELELSSIMRDVEELNVNVVSFNYRGVAQSTGSPKSIDDLLVDGIAQVQRLLENGVLPENITLKSHSLGGAVGTLVAHHFHQQGITLNLFNSCSFSSTTNEVVGMIRVGNTNTGHKETVGYKVLGFLAKPFVKFCVSLVKWEINAGEAFKAIPEKYKEYILIRSAKNERNKSGIYDDSVIPHYASIHNFLKSERQAKKVAWKDAESTHAKNRKMSAGASFDCHNVSRSKLKNRSGQTANEFFNEFVRRKPEVHANTTAQLN